MKLSLAHIVTYLVAGLVWLATLDQTFVAGIVGAKFAPYASAVIVFAGAVVVFLQHVGVIAPPAPTVITVPAASGVIATVPPVSKQSGFVSLRYSMFLAITAGMLLSLGACSTVQSWLGSPTAAATIPVIVDVAVATAEAKGVPAAQINKVAKAALAADSGTAGTLTAISALIDTQIASSGLPAADLAAAKILEVALGAAITSAIGNNASLATAQAAVADVLNAAIAATGG